MKNNKRFLIYGFAILLLIIDLIVKLFLKNNMELGDEIILIPNLFSIYYVENSGAAFSILQNKTIFLIIVSLFCLVFLDRMIVSYNSKLENISISLIIGGLFGNLVDRMLYSRVIDYISIMEFPVFNLADSFIVIGVIIFIYCNIIKKDDVKE